LQHRTQGAAKFENGKSLAAGGSASIIGYGRAKPPMQRPQPIFRGTAARLESSKQAHNKAESDVAAARAEAGTAAVAAGFPHVVTAAEAELSRADEHNSPRGSRLLWLMTIGFVFAIVTGVVH
jgi:hypothetical protein